MNTLKNLSGRTTRRLNTKLAERAKRFKFPPSHAIIRSPEQCVPCPTKANSSKCRMRRVKSPQKTIVRATTARRLEYLLKNGLVLDTESGGFDVAVAVTRYRKRHMDGTVTTEKIDDNSPTCGV